MDSNTFPFLKEVKMSTYEKKQNIRQVSNQKTDQTYNLKICGHI